MEGRDFTFYDFPVAPCYSIWIFFLIQRNNHAYGEISCPDAGAMDQGAYSCEAINIKGSCFAGSAGCGQPGQDAQVVSESRFFLR